MSYSITAVENALSLLEVVAENPHVGVTRLSELAGKTKSLTFRLLYTLEAQGYVVKDPDTSEYSLGYRVLFLGERAKHQTDLVRIAEPIMRALTDVSRETSHLVVREGLNSLVVGIVEGPRPLRLYAEVGRRGPLHAGGGSKVMLAFAPEEVREQVLSGVLERHTDATLTEPDALREVLADIVKNGYHVAESDLDDDAFSVAAPIRNETGAVVASITVAGPQFRLTKDAREAHIKGVLRASRQISRLLGRVD